MQCSRNVFCSCALYIIEKNMMHSVVARFYRKSLLSSVLHVLHTLNTLQKRSAVVYEAQYSS